MFANTPFYHGTVRSFIAAFGKLFSGITLLNVDGTGKKEQVIRVPISYGPKNKWLERLKAQPDLNTPVLENTLPRLAFEITDYRYDATRKVGTQGNYVAGRLGAGGAKLFNPVPYDVTVQLHTLTKDSDDSFKILEQILPYFSPALVMNIEVVPQFKIKKDIPLILESVSIADSYDGDKETNRAVTQTFTFTAKLDLFGPVKEGAVIKNVEINFNDMKNVPIESIDFTVDPFTANKEDPHTVVETRTFQE